MITIEIYDEFSDCIDSTLILDAVKTTLSYLDIQPDATLTVVISDDRQVHLLNQQFRGVDTPTDVLSFPASHVDPESGKTYLGDVILSYPRAADQAKEFGESILDEIQLLVVHGVLHLLGYDHKSSSQKINMWETQNMILDQLGITDHGMREP